MAKNGKRLLSGLALYGTIELIYWLGYSIVSFRSSYLAEKGFTESQIGTVMAICSLVGILSTILLGNLSDKWGSPRKVFLICVLGVTAAFSFVPKAVGIYIGPVCLLFVLNYIWSFFFQSAMGIGDSWVMEVSARTRAFTYDRIRFLGSFGYAVMCLVFGMLAKKFGSQDIIFYVYGCLNIILVPLIIYARRDDGEPVRRAQGTKIGVRALFSEYHLLIFLLCHALVYPSMGCALTFIPSVLEKAGADLTNVGLINCLRSLSEIPALFLSAWFIKKWNVRRLLTLTMFLFIAVQLVFAFANALWMVALAMMLLGFINGAYVAAQVRYAHSIAPAGGQSSAVSLCVTVNCISSMIINFVGGHIVERFSIGTYFGFVMCVASVGLILFLISVPLGNKLGKQAPDLTQIV